MLFGLVLLAAGRYLGWTGLPGHSAAQWAYVLTAGSVLALGFQLLRNRLDRKSGTPSWTEDVRLGSLLILAVWLFRTFLTPDFFGGVDARSYGYTMVDVLEQARAGVFPVFVGQGEFMFNGAIHPIRTAPYHHYLGMFLDALTARSLTPLAIQHLTVVVTAAQAGLTCYVTLVWLAPAMRWQAWFMAALYLSAPAASAYIYGQEMYMTFMAFAYLPIVFLGNIWLIRRNDFSGWACLSVGLALTWLCHAPVAVWLTLCTLGVQGLRLLMRDFNFASWRRAVGGVLLLGGLTAYYFYSIAEISVLAGSTHGYFSLADGVLVAGIVALIRYLATGHWTWTGAAGVAVVILGIIRPTAGGWLGAALGLSFGLVRAGRYWPAFRWRERLPECVVLVMLVGGLSTLPWLPRLDALPALGWVLRLFPLSLQPVSDKAQLLTDLQVGYALWGALGLGLAASVFTPNWENRLLGLVAGLWLALVLPLPGVSRLLLGAVPDAVYAVSSDIAYLRYLPTLLGLAVFLGFLGFAGCSTPSPSRRGMAFLLAGMALGWSLWEAEKFVRCGYRNVNQPEAIKAFYRPENARQFPYIFPKMPVSPYLTNGVVDYHWESRLLRADDPALEVPAAVDWSAARVVTFATWIATTRVSARTPYWLHLEPTLTLAPGERLLLRFEFFDKPYTGTLLAQGPNGFYREYQLPAAGFFAKSFGVAPERPKTIALWNSSDQPQPVELIFIRAELPANGKPFGDFARVAILPYAPDRLPIRTLGLIPYRAQVRTETPVYLESPRVFVPGYRARVDGQSAPVEESPNHLAMVRLNAGEHVVEVFYRGTYAARMFFRLSMTVWFTVLVYGGWQLYRRSQYLPPSNFPSTGGLY